MHDKSQPMFPNVVGGVSFNPIPKRFVNSSLGIVIPGKDENNYLSIYLPIYLSILPNLV